MTAPARDLLGLEGPIARAFGETYEPRPQQLRMADAVERTLDEQGRLLVEAGTGVGKSYAYLIPAIRRCIEHGETVVVSTHTIALQEQLVSKDIPALVEALGLGDELRPVLVKGRGNYLSVRRLKMASARQDRLIADAAGRRSLHQIEDWAYRTEDGTLSSLPPLERPGVWDHVRSDSGNCMGRKCPTYDLCFYQTARREMDRGNLLVCNHALFFSDLAMRAQSDVGFLPEYHHVILDEAHTVEEVAGDHFGLSLSEGRVSHLLGQIYSRRTNKGFLANLELVTGDTEPIERCIVRVGDAEASARSMFDELLRLAETDECKGGRVRRAGAVENPLTPAMNDVVVALKRLKDITKADPDRFELNGYAQRASAIADAAEALVEQTLEGCCYWIEQSGGDRGRRRVTLSCSPIEVGPLLERHLFGGEFSVVMTSATLATRTVGEDEPAEHAEAAFTHVIDRTGAHEAKTMQLGSPFDFARQLEVYVERSMPMPAYGRDQRDYLEALVGRTLDHVSATEGGAFVLFTSFALLEKAAAELVGPLDTLGMPMLVQGRGAAGVSRTELTELFREAGNAVLLGAASFWQGVDVRGDALRNVILTRLPFDPPERPLTEARLDLIRERGGDPFREESLPRAVIRFKQGVGRLIRSASDTGRVVILDPRVVTKPYGKLFVQALPEGARVELVE
ncbi:MAG: helicase C-terminal domain-containing protein [Planctomycetota bacterium]